MNPENPNPQMFEVATQTTQTSQTSQASQKTQEPSFAKKAVETASKAGSKTWEFIKEKKKELIQSLIAFVIVFILVIFIKTKILGVSPPIWDTLLIIGAALITKPLVTYAYHKIGEQISSPSKVGQTEGYMEPV
jgi:hypothetical protein